VISSGIDLPVTGSTSSCELAGVWGAMRVRPNRRRWPSVDRHPHELTVLALTGRRNGKPQWTVAAEIEATSPAPVRRKRL
jgi:hypothetical protein